MKITQSEDGIIEMTAENKNDSQNLLALLQGNGLLKKGDKVVMHSCAEAKEANGKIFVCQTDEYKFKDGDMVVFLEDYSGAFLTKYLQKVSI